MLDLFFGASTAAYWIMAGIMAAGLVGIKLVMINFDRKHKDKK